MKRLLFLVLVAALMVPLAKADTFTLSSYTVSLRTTDPGLVLNWSPDFPTPHTFNLNPGDNTGWFSLLDLWTNESTVNSDDLVAYPISVTLNFSQPFVSGTVGGETQGTSILWGFIQSGQVTWNGPAVVPFGDNGQFSIYLQDAYFNTGLLGLSDCGTDIFAKIKYDSAPTGPAPGSVPEPGTLLLLGTGLAGIGSKLRKKKAV